MVVRPQRRHVGGRGGERSAELEEAKRERVGLPLFLSPSCEELAKICQGVRYVFRAELREGSF